MTDEAVRAAGRSVRQFLPELVGPQAERLDAAIAGLLLEPGSESQLRRLLEQTEGTRAFLGAIMDDAPAFRPPQARPATMKDAHGYSGLPGRIGALTAPKFRCPIGDDFDWWQLNHNDPIPACPTHQSTLVRVQA